jgi:2-polyprenyl-3-methyl-5-hydroxy-6-metoxy-1,4-benzoquinol methylase
MTQVNKCLVCSSSDVKSYLTCSDHLTGGESFSIYTCNSCGFLFTANPPPENEIEKYYSTSDYISHSDTKKGVTNALYHFTRNLMLRRKKNLVNKVTGSGAGTLLDIGCGTGYFAAFMKDSGWNVTGLEVNETARSFAKEKFNLEVINENKLPEIEENHFDCITLWHVFEHLFDPVKYLSEIRRLLKPGGMCIIAMPNFGSCDARHYNEYWAAWDVPRHLWHFTPDTFNILAEKNGFKLVKTKSLPADVFYISILSERYRGTNLPFITGMIKGLWFALLSLFYRKRSSSLIYILEYIS